MEERNGHTVDDLCPPLIHHCLQYKCKLWSFGTTSSNVYTREKRNWDANLGEYTWLPTLYWKTRTSGLSFPSFLSSPDANDVRSQFVDQPLRHERIGNATSLPQVSLVWSEEIPLGMQLLWLQRGYWEPFIDATVTRQPIGWSQNSLKWQFITMATQVHTWPHPINVNRVWSILYWENCHSLEVFDMTLLTPSQPQWR